MKISKIGLFLLSVFMIVFVGCKTDENDDEPLYSSSSNTMVRSFYLSDDTLSNVDNLSKRFFTIDLKSRNIYNADSLPYGANITKLMAKIEFSSPSKVEIYVKGKDDSGSDVTKTINYLETPSDSINFSGGRGSVTMKVIAADGTTEQEYIIDVRVHKVKADSLIWEDMGQRELPVANPAAQKTVMKDGTVYCFVKKSNGGYELAKTATPGNGNWQSAVLPQINDFDLNSIIVSPDGFYALAGTGASKTLMSSSDGVNWSPVSGTAFYSLIGMYQNTLLGIVKEGSVYKHASYPQQGELTAVSSDFPVSGFSNTVSYQSEWGTNQIVFVGGRLSDGTTLSNSVWGFDGENWASLNNINGGGGGAPISPREGAMFFSYYTYKYNSSLDYYTELLTYFIIGGSTGSEVLNDLYTTTDLGGIWTKAESGSSLALPNILTGRAFASAVVCEEKINARSGRLLWKAVENPLIPRGMRFTKALTTEPVPYIYMFGGVSKSGVLYNEVWKGVIRRLTFEPIP